MKSKIITFIRKPFIKNVAFMVSGAAAAQLIAMVLSPFITRVYGPEAYGIMGTFMAIVQILIPLAALKFPIAIVLPEDNKEAIELVRLSFFTVLFVTFLVSLLLFMFHSVIVSAFGLEEVSIYLYFIPLAVFFAGLVEICEQWLIRTKQFYVTAKTNFLRSIIINGGKLSTGYFFPYSFVLIIFSTLQDAVRVFLISYFKKLSIKSVKYHLLKRGSLKNIIKKYKDFPLYRSPQSVINSISQGIPVLLLSSLFGPASAGFYSIARTVLSMPTVLIGNSVGDVFYPRIAEAGNRNENLTKLIIKASVALGLVGIIPFGTIILFGPELFGLIFGQDWMKAGEYARWLSFWLYLTLVIQPASKSLPVLSALKFHLIFTIVTIILPSTSFLISYYFFNNDVLAVIFLAITSAFLNLILFLITIKLANNFQKKSSR